MAEKYDDVLLPFLALMRKELHANTRKGDRPGWLAMDANTLLLEVYWHAAKLSAAVKNNDGPSIMEHSADVANMAVMVLDTCGGIAWAALELQAQGADDMPPEVAAQFAYFKELASDPNCYKGRMGKLLAWLEKKHG